VSDTAAIYRALNTHRKEEKIKNRAEGIAALNRSNLPYVSKNMGDHLVITHPVSLIDFWPTTRRWRIRKKKLSGFGFDELLKKLG